MLGAERGSSLVADRRDRRAARGPDDAAGDLDRSGCQSPTPEAGCCGDRGAAPGRLVACHGAVVSGPAGRWAGAGWAASLPAAAGTAGWTGEPADPPSACGQLLTGIGRCGQMLSRVAQLRYH